jgi:hypothetical protein
MTGRAAARRGAFRTVNESPWEHLKMAFWANLFWWMIGYYGLKKGGKLSAAGWFSSCAASLYIAPLFIVSFYYTYTGALGFSSMILDVLSLLLGLGVSRYAAAHIFKYGKPLKACLALSAAAISLLAAVFIVFTFYPPRLPMFLDRNTGLYGI